MLYTPHALVGATLAYVFPNPVVALTLSLVSHLLFDVAPHSNPSPKRANKWLKIIIIAEVILGNILLVLFSHFLAKNNFQFFLMLFAGVVANLPDLLMVPYVLFKKDYKICKEISVFQKSIQTHVSKKWGYTIQVALILLIFLSFLNAFLPNSL